MICPTMLSNPNWLLVLSVNARDLYVYGSNPFGIHVYSKCIYLWGNATNGDNGYYTTLTNFSTKYLLMCKVYTDEDDMK